MFFLGKSYKMLVTVFNKGLCRLKKIVDVKHAIFNFENLICCFKEISQTSPSRK